MAPARSVIALTLSVFCSIVIPPVAGAKICSLEQVMELPMIDDNEPIVAIAIDGQPRRVLIDTGGFWSLIRPSLAGRGKIFSMAVEGRLGLDGIPLNRGVTISSLQLGSTLFKNVDFFLSPEGYGDIDATLGANWLKLFDVELHLAAKRVALFHQSDCYDAISQWLSQSVKSALTLDIDKAGEISLPASVDGQSVAATIDTGSPKTVLDLDTARRLFSLGPDSPGAKPNKDKTAFEYQFRSIQIGNVTLTDPHVLIAPIKFGDTKLILGTPELRRMRLYFAYAAHRLYVADVTSEAWALKLSEPAKTVPKSGPSPAAVKLMIAAQNALFKKDFDEAGASIEQAMQIDPQSAALFEMRARYYAAKKDDEHALADASEAIRLDENYLQGYSTRADLYADKGDLDHAIQDMTAILRSRPNSFVALANRGVLYERQGDYDHALQDTEASLRLFPLATNAASASERCRIEALQGRLDVARDDCDEANKRERNSDALMDARAFVDLKAGRLDDAIERYDKVLRYFPGYALSLYGRGLAERQKGDTESGDEDIAAALKRNPRIGERFGKQDANPGLPHPPS